MFCSISSSDQSTQNYIWEVFWDNVVVCDRFDHLDVEFLFSISESGLEHNKVVIVNVCLKVDSLGEGWHFASGQVDSALYFTGTIAELEHVGVVFAMVGFQSAYDWDGVKGLVIEWGVFFQLIVDLMDGKRDDGLVVDWFVLFLGGVHFFSRLQVIIIIWVWDLKIYKWIKKEGDCKIDKMITILYFLSIWMVIYFL